MRGCGLYSDCRHSEIRGKMISHNRRHIIEYDWIICLILIYSIKSVLRYVSERGIALNTFNDMLQLEAYHCIRNTPYNTRKVCNIQTKQLYLQRLRIEDERIWKVKI